MGQEKKLEAELNELLSEDVSSVLEREKTAFDRLVEPFGESLVLFGAGNLGRQVLSRLRQDGIEPLAFSDNNPTLWGRFIEGVCVLPPAEAAEKFGDRAAFVVTIWSPGSQHRFAETKRNLSSLNCKKVISFASFFWKYAETFLPDCYFDLPHKIYQNADGVRTAFSGWADEASRVAYLTQLKWRILADFDGLPGPVPQVQYFPEDIFSLRTDEVFVDCGAYNGDTIREFLKRNGDSFARIIAFEPDPLNFQDLSLYVQHLPVGVRQKITLLQKAVGMREEKLRLTVTGTAASIVGMNGGTEIDSVPLDGALDNLVPTYIKMDIEGAEIDAIIGAKNIIARDCPVLAVCAYHRQDHLWRIPMLIRTITSEYHFFLRPHDEEGWDLVCYAIPDKRLKK